MIQTKILFLRELLLTDLNDIHTLLSLPETDKYNALGIPENTAVTEKMLNEWISEQESHARTSFVYAIELKESNNFIGLIALLLGKPKYLIGEVWFKTHPDHWGKGYTTEAVLELIRFGFEELQLHRMEAGCAVENIASGKVLEKAGMTREGMKRKLLPKDGDWKDCYFYAMLEEDFFSKSNRNLK